MFIRFSGTKKKCLLWLTVTAVLFGVTIEAIGGKSGSPAASEWTQPAGKAPLSLSRLQELAQNDYAALFEQMCKNYHANVRDYTGLLSKTERIGGKLGRSQEISFKFMEEPFSLVMNWTKNPGSTDRLLYVDGANGNNMLVHPTGLFSWIKSVRRKPNCKDAMKANLYPCNRFGFGRMLQRLQDIHRIARQNGPVRTNYIGLANVDERTCLEMQVDLPDSKGLNIARCNMKIDAEYLVPVELSSFDKKGNLISRYAFSNLKFNVGLNNQHFSPAANGL